MLCRRPTSKQTLPGVCPGVCRTRQRNDPSCDRIAVVKLAIERRPSAARARPSQLGLKRERAIERQIGRMEQRLRRGQTRAGARRRRYDRCARAYEPDTWRASPLRAQTSNDFIDAIAAVDDDRIAARVSSARIVAVAGRSGTDRRTSRAIIGTALINVDAEVVETAVEVTERRARARAAREDVTDEDRVRADLIFVRQLAVEVRDGTVENWCAGGVGRIADVGELTLANLAGEMLGEPPLVAGEHVDAENRASSR